MNVSNHKGPPTIFELSCPWCPTSILVRIREYYPPPTGGNKSGDSKKLISEHARFDEKIIKELIAHARVHIRYMNQIEPQGKHDRDTTDPEIRNEWIYKVVHLPHSSMP